MARVSEEEQRFADPNDFLAKAKEYIMIKKQIDYLTDRQKTLREEVFSGLDTEGEFDSKGNLVFELDSPIEGVVRIVKQRKVSRKLDEPVAEEIIKGHHLEDTLYKTVQILDEEAIMASLYSGELTAEEIDIMFPESVTWALMIPKK
jgi:hypothetical protein